MKTTVEIAEPLLEDARAAAARDGETLRSLIENGLRRELAHRKRKPTPFKLRQVTFGEGGLRTDGEPFSWRDIIDMSYEGRGA